MNHATEIRSKTFDKVYTPPGSQLEKRFRTRDLIDPTIEGGDIQTHETLCKRSRSRIRFF